MKGDWKKGAICKWDKKKVYDQNREIKLKAAKKKKKLVII